MADNGEHLRQAALKRELAAAAREEATTLRAQANALDARAQTLESQAFQIERIAHEDTVTNVTVHALDDPGIITT